MDRIDLDSYLRRLEKALRERGLKVSARGTELTVTNPRIGTEHRLSPGLGQKVLLDDRNGDGLAWYWVWPPLRRAVPSEQDQEPEFEFMCDASRIERAARLIAKVIRLHDEDDA